MTVILESHKLFYAAVPKVACSSIKRMLFEVENGFAFQNYRANGQLRHIHGVYPTVPFKRFPFDQIADFRRLCLVRDPVQRLLSAYSNRVIHHRELTPEAVAKTSRFKRLTPHPELDEFVDRLERYMAVPAIKGHCRPMIDMLGEDVGFYHAIYDIRRMDEFIADVSDTVGRPLEAGRFQTGGPKIDKSELTAAQTAKLERFYKRDYEVFGSSLKG